MNISIVIPCLNEERYLPQLLLDLNNQTIKPKEIIVVDAGSQDKTLSLIQDKYELVKVFTVLPNIGAQRDFGAGVAQGDFLFFMDSDVRMHRDFLEKAISEFNTKRLSLACPTYVPYTLSNDTQMINSTNFIVCVYKLLDAMFYLFQAVLPSGAGSGILVTKELYVKAGGFRSDLKFDDIAFIRKASKHGRFGKLRTKLMVSDRRFRRYGPVKVFISYMLLSVFFVFNAFKFSEVVSYSFNDYHKK